MAALMKGGGVCLMAVSRTGRALLTADSVAGGWSHTANRWQLRGTRGCSRSQHSEVLQEHLRGRGCFRSIWGGKDAAGASGTVGGSIAGCVQVNAWLVAPPSIGGGLPPRLQHFAELRSGAALCVDRRRCSSAFFDLEADVIRGGETSALACASRSNEPRETLGELDVLV